MCSSLGLEDDGNEHFSMEELRHAATHTHCDPEAALAFLLANPGWGSGCGRVELYKSLMFFRSLITSLFLSLTLSLALQLRGSTKARLRLRLKLELGLGLGLGLRYVHLCRFLFCHPLPSSSASA